MSAVTVGFVLLGLAVAASSDLVVVVVVSVMTRSGSWLTLSGVLDEVT